MGEKGRRKLKFKTAACILLTLAMFIGMLAIPIPVRADGGDFTYITKSGAAEITGYTGAGGEVTIPAVLGNCPVTAIAAGAFANKESLTMVIFPQSITKIGQGAFAGCGSLTAAYFYGNAPALWVNSEGGSDVFSRCEVDFYVYYINRNTGYSNPWYGYPAATFSIPVANIRLNTNALSLTWGNSINLSVTIEPQTATDKTLSWVSGNPKVVTVSNSGAVTGAGVGSATITCRTNDGSGKTAISIITVIPKAPGSIGLAKRTDTSIYLDWAKVDGITGYEVYRAASASGTYAKIKTQSNTNFIDTSIIKGKAYYYKVLAYKTLGAVAFKSTYSSMVTTVNAPSLLGGVNAYAKGMAESLYNVSYTPERKDVDAKYQAVDVSLTKFYHYSEIETILNKLGKSKSVDLYKIGTTVDKRNIYSLEIGTGTQTQLFTAGLHGNEACNPVYLLKFAATVVNKWNTGDKGIVAMLKAKRLCMVVVSNPDIFEATIWGSSAIKNKNLYIVKYAKTHSNLYSYKANANGVDLNRAFPSYASGMIYNKLYKSITPVVSPAAKNFPGSTLGSEPETQALIKWFKAKLPSAKTFMDIHSQGRMIYQGKTFISDKLNSNCYNLAAKLNKVCGYYIIPLKNQRPGQGDGGTSTDFAAELCSGFVFNSTLGRNIPAGANISGLVKKTQITKYNTAVVTVETSVDVSPRQSGIAIQNKEWTKYKLYDTLLSVCKT